MLLSNKEIVRKRLLEETSGISVYRGRKDKIKIGGVGFNTIDKFLKKDVFLSNKTLFKFIENFGWSYDKEFYNSTRIIKIIEQ